MTPPWFSNLTALLFMTLALCGCGGRFEEEFIVGGFPSPDASLDAMIQAIRNEDIQGFQDCWGLNPGEPRNIEKVFRHYDNATTPRAISDSWKAQLQFWKEDHWKEGHYKRFPQEITGNKASITCAHTLGRYARYEFRKLPGGWYLAAHVVLRKDKVDPVYIWNKSEP